MFEAALLVAALLQSPAAAAAPAITAADRALLAASDPFARAPASSRSRLRIGAGGKHMSVEIWRSGENGLVRFLDARERGKFLLRLPAGAYFISPGARQPIRLPPTHRLAGAVALDELFGVGIAGRYEAVGIARRDPAARVVEFELRADTPQAPYPRLRWVVDQGSRLPLRADFMLADGRVARVVEWKTWRDRATLQPRTLTVKDVLRRDPPAEVEVLDFATLDVPAGLFSLSDPAARAALDK
jgi:hypothetical protein